MVNCFNFELKCHQQLFLDLELGSEGDSSVSTRSNSAHPIRKRIAIKLKPPGKSQTAKGKKGPRAKSTKTYDDHNLVNDGMDGMRFMANLIRNSVILIIRGTEATLFLGYDESTDWERERGRGREDNKPPLVFKILHQRLKFDSCISKAVARWESLPGSHVRLGGKL